MMNSKICSKCGIEKEIGEYSIRKDKDRNGVVVERINSQCKLCNSKRRKEWMNNNSDKMMGHSKRYYDSHPEQCREKAREWRKRNSTKMQNYMKKWRSNRDRFEVALARSQQDSRVKGYAGCSATVDEIREAFTGKCQNPACGIPEEECTVKLHMDHDHVTGQFRAWLCHRCNTVLGYVRDDPEMLKSLADYLESHTIQNNL